MSAVHFDQLIVYTAVRRGVTLYSGVISLNHWGGLSNLWRLSLRNVLFLQ